MMKISLLLACFAVIHANPDNTVRPRIWAEIGSVRVKVNESVTLTCYAKGESLSNFTWKSVASSNDGTDLTDFTTISHRNETQVTVMTLRFSIVKRRDEGTYRCLVHFSKGEIGDSVSLTVKDVPRVYLYSASAEGTSMISLAWDLDEGNDHVVKTSLRYLKNGTSEWLDYTGAVDALDKRTILRGFENGTTYQFKMIASNSMGDSSVAYSPWVTTYKKVYGSITGQPAIVSARANDSATLTCYVEGELISDVTWNHAEQFYYEKELVHPTAIWDYNKALAVMTLHFPSVTRQDAGKYQCTANFSGHFETHFVELEVYDVPHIEIIDALAIGANSIYIEWYTDNGNHPLLMTLIQYTKTSHIWESYPVTDVKIIRRVFMKDLENGTAYQFRILSSNAIGNSPIVYTDWVTTFEEDPAFIPEVLIKATTFQSITIGCSMPPAKLQEYFNRCTIIAMTHGNVIKQDIITVYPLDYTLKNLKSNTTYQLKVAACNYHSGRCSNWSKEQEIVTIDRDPKFIPNVTVERTTRDSIMIEWSWPPTEFRDRVYQYKAIANRRKETTKPIYLTKTVNTHVFRHLEPDTIYVLQVAACGEFETQCGNWSSEQEAFTRDEGSHVVKMVNMITATKGAVPGAILAGTIAAVILLAGVTVSWLMFRHRQEKAARRRFIEATLERFNGTVPDCLDLELNMAERAELLPYDKKWEFPRELLKLDNAILGSGAFGIVRKAQAKSICRKQPVTTVAVKVVRATASLDHMTALTRELKILAYLGKHVNVVNLLGACTTHVSYGQLMVIVEYCRFGNLRDYLLHRRGDFEHKDDTASTENVITGSCSTEDPTNTNGSSADRAGSDSRSATEDCVHGIDIPEISVAIGDLAPKSDSQLAEPEPRAKYHGDFADVELEPIGTDDLLCWAWQVSRGMKYLGTRRILHGDLAARNILLADNNVVKICDFGLARALYMDENYQKKGHDPLPYKWMAMESLKHRIFSVRSDVWSYGVVLWEFFSLGKTPYSGIHPESLYGKLADGFRMEQPKYACDDMYRVMLHCWDAKPSQRPSFKEIEDSLAYLLHDSVKMHYLMLDSTYAQLDDEAFTREETDNLTTGPPEDAVETTDQTVESDRL